VRAASAELGVSFARYSVRPAGCMRNKKWCGPGSAPRPPSCTPRSPETPPGLRWVAESQPTLAVLRTSDECNFERGAPCGGVSGA